MFKWLTPAYQSRKRYQVPHKYHSMRDSGSRRMRGIWEDTPPFVLQQTLLSVPLLPTQPQCSSVVCIQLRAPLCAEIGCGGRRGTICTTQRHILLIYVIFASLAVPLLDNTVSTPSKRKVYAADGRSGDEAGSQGVALARPRGVGNTQL